jgi:hypothetical protein
VDAGALELNADVHLSLTTCEIKNGTLGWLCPLDGESRNVYRIWVLKSVKNSHWKTEKRWEDCDGSHWIQVLRMAVGWNWIRQFVFRDLKKRNIPCH